MRLDLVVGPNGAGKSTFVRKVLMRSLPAGTPFVNADEIAARQWPDEPEARSYDAARIAEATRTALVSARRPFVAETVFSHPSKLDLVARAQQDGFTVALHVLLVPEELSVRRVEHRTAAGGHTVPEVKVRQRYQRLWRLVGQAMEVSDHTSVYDSSGIKGPRVVAHLVEGVPVGDLAWPRWAPTDLTSRWPGSSSS